jgi:DNA-directed RNA polymerase specialized sigma24 family protein
MSLAQPDRERLPQPSSLFGPPTRRSLIERLGRAPTLAEQFRDDWEWFLVRYEQPIRVTARRHLIRQGRQAAATQDLEDAVQEVWKKLLGNSDNLARWDPAKGRFRQYLQGIVENTCRSLRNQHRRYGNRYGPLPELDDATTAGTALDQLQAEEERAWNHETVANAGRSILERLPRSAEQLLGYAGLCTSQDTPAATQVSREDLLNAVCREGGVDVDRLSAEEKKLKLNAIDKGLGRARQAFWEAVTVELTLGNRDADSMTEDFASVRRYVEAAFPRLIGRDSQS